MKSKTFVMLLALCAVLGLATYFVSTADRNSGKKSSGAEDKFLSELPVNDIASISVKDAENEVLLEKGESVWVVKNRFGYPADFGKIAEFAKNSKIQKWAEPLRPLMTPVNVWPCTVRMKRTQSRKTKALRSL